MCASLWPLGLPHFIVETDRFHGPGLHATLTALKKKHTWWGHAVPGVRLTGSSY